VCCSVPCLVRGCSLSLSSPTSYFNEILKIVGQGHAG
jgi:hypothetical protein